jgi:acyl transferase domain-containing protein/NADPH:quinone reductase-like Zn-dependent oxidoreductase
LLDELQKDEQTTQINAAHISQPACTAVQLALVDLLRSWKVTPTAVVGHSSGEIAAAYSADIITFEDAMTIAYHRGRLIPILKEKYPALSGSMMAVGTGAAEVAPLLERIPSHLGEARIACINSPSSVTVSGDSDAVTEVQRLIEEKYPGMFARRLAVDTAYHSHHMNLVAKEYTDSLRQLAPPRPSTISFHSSLLGRSASYVDLDATYWVQNLTCAVRFDQAVQDMCGPVGDLKTSVNFLVELGPHAALQGPLKQILKHIGATANKIGYSSVLSRKKDAVQTALALAGTLFVKGSLLDMGEINFPKPPERLPQVLTDMPRYAWNHSTSYYHESRLTKIHKYHDGRRHDLLGVLAPYSDSIEPTWRNILRLDDVPWLRHHQMQGVTIFPISGFAVMAIEAMAQQAQSKNMQYEALQVVDLTVKVPAMLTEEDLEMTTTLRSCSESSDGTKFDFHIRSWSESKGWTENCTGSVLACLSTSHVNAVDGNRIKKHKESRLEKRISQAKLLAKEPISAEDMYKRLSEIGVSYGTNLQGIDECFASPDTSHAQLRLSDTIAEMPEHQESEYVLHPTLLEQLITMYWPILYAKGPLNTVHLPSTIGTITVSSKASTYIREKLGMQAFCEPTSKLSNSRPNKLSMVATTDTSEQLIAIENLSITPILETSMDTEAEGARELCFRLDWEPIIMPDDSESPSTCQSQFDADIVIIHGDSESQLQLASTLSDRLLALTGTIPAAGTLDAMADVASDKLCIIVPELDQPILANMDVAKFEALQRLLTTVRGALWVVRGAYTNPAHPDTNMITGLSRTLRSEGTLMNFITLDLDCAKDDEAARQVSTILHVLTRTLSTARNTEETEFAERHGQLMTPRIVNDDSLNEFVDKQVHPPATEPASFLDIQRPLQGRLQTPHVLDSLTFEDLKPSELCEDEVEIQVKAIGLSSRDIEADSAIGLECSGVVTAVGSNVPNFHAGDRVAGFTPNGSLSTITRAQHPFLFKLPHHTSFESAAAIPLAYCTASYALRDQAQLREGETILVHDGATPVGQAAISISQTLGADVWTTVKNTAEKALLMQHFCIVEDRILYALSEDFAETIEESTGGRGVDVIFDSLTEPRLDGATCRSLADFGQHIKVGAHKSQERTPLKANTTMLSIDIIALGKHRPRVIQRSLADVARMLNYGMIQPVQDIKTYGISQMATALHDVHASGPNSSVVVIPQTDDLVMVSNCLPTALPR